MIRRLEERDCANVSMTGGKGAALARMTALGIRVPPGFVVSAGALLRGLEGAGALSAVAELVAGAAGGGPAQRRRIAQEIQACVRAVPLCHELVADVSDAYALLGDEVPVAVRSSACCEDSVAASCAGLQATFLQVIGAGAVLESIRACWAAFYSERAIAYRAHDGSFTELGIAVVVQRMVAADVAGVLFTVDPVAGRTDRIDRRGRLRAGRGRRVRSPDARRVRARTQRPAHSTGPPRAALCRRAARRRRHAR